MAESEEELHSLLMKVKEESENVGLKLNIQKTNIMVSGLITSWQIDGETVETVAYFILWGSKITADGNCSQEIKRSLFLGRKVMTNLLLLLLLSRFSPSSMGFSRQEHRSRVPSPSPMTNLDSILKSRDITLPTKVRLVKAMVFQ